MIDSSSSVWVGFGARFLAQSSQKIRSSSTISMIVGGGASLREAIGAVDEYSSAASGRGFSPAPPLEEGAGGDAASDALGAGAAESAAPGLTATSAYPFLIFSATSLADSADAFAGVSNAFVWV